MAIGIDTFLPALLGGALIGFAATLLLWLNGRLAGISGIFCGACSLRSQEMRCGAFCSWLVWWAALRCITRCQAMRRWRVKRFLHGYWLCRDFWSAMARLWATDAPAVMVCAGWEGCHCARWSQPWSSC